MHLLSYSGDGLSCLSDHFDEPTSIGWGGQVTLVRGVSFAGERGLCSVRPWCCFPSGGVVRCLKLEGKLFCRTTSLNCPGERKQQFTKEQTSWVILCELSQPISEMDDSLQRGSLQCNKGNLCLGTRPKSCWLSKEFSWLMFLVQY